MGFLIMFYCMSGDKQTKQFVGKKFVYLKKVSLFNCWFFIYEQDLSYNDLVIPCSILIQFNLLRNVLATILLFSNDDYFTMAFFTLSSISSLYIFKNGTISLLKNCLKLANYRFNVILSPL